MRLFHYSGLSSTQTQAKILSDSGIKPAFIVQADYQTAGQGRLARRQWHSPPGNLYCTATVPISQQQNIVLPIYVGAGLHQILQAFIGQNAALRLKWPNDIYLEGKKLAGLLIEQRGDICLIGLGLNLRHAPHIPNYATIALSQVNPNVDSMLLRSKIFSFLLDLSEKTMNKAWCAAARQYWQQALIYHNQPVHIVDIYAQSFRGQITGVTTSGALCLQDQAGEMHQVVPKEVNDDRVNQTPSD